MPSLLELLRDALRFLSRHYRTIETWPLQVYSSAIVFSPRKSLVREHNTSKIPTWLKQLPEVETEWDPLLQTLEGHSNWVNAMAYSPYGQHIVSGSSDKTVKVWDAATGKLDKTLDGHSGPVSAVAYSPDGQHIVSGSFDKTVKVWDAATGKLDKTLNGHSDTVMAVAYSPDGQHIVSGSDDKTVKVWMQRQVSSTRRSGVTQAGSTL